MSMAAKTTLHMYQLLSEFFIVKDPVNLWTDSTTAETMAKNNINSNRTKHIWIIYRFITDWISRGLFKLAHIPGKINPADLLTKVPRDTNYVTLSEQLFSPMPSSYT